MDQPEEVVEDEFEKALRERQMARQTACQVGLQELLAKNKCKIDIVTIHVNGQLVKQEISFKPAEIK